MATKKRAKATLDQHKAHPKLIRADVEQWERWQKAADRDLRTLTDWIRVTLDDAALGRKR